MITSLIIYAYIFWNENDGVDEKLSDIDIEAPIPGLWTSIPELDDSIMILLNFIFLNVTFRMYVIFYALIYFVFLYIVSLPIL